MQNKENKNNTIMASKTPQLSTNLTEENLLKLKNTLIKINLMILKKNYQLKVFIILKVVKSQLVIILNHPVCLILFQR